MRLAILPGLLFALAYWTSTAQADPRHLDEKPWSLPTWQARAEIPEDELSNNICPGQSMSCGDVITPAALTVADTDWFCFQAEAGQVLTIATNEIPGQPTADTFLDLFADDCTQVLASDDDGGPGLYSLISFLATYTGSYYASVSGFSETSLGSYQLSVTCTLPPAGNTCSDPLFIQRCTMGTLLGDSSQFANNYDPGSGNSCTGFSALGRDIVYTLDLTSGDVVDMTYTQFDFDASFYVVTDCGNLVATCAGGADDTVTGDPEVIQFTATQTTTHFVILDVFGANTGGEWQLDYSIQCEVAAEQASWSDVKTTYR